MDINRLRPRFCSIHQFYSGIKAFPNPTSIQSVPCKTAFLNGFLYAKTGDDAFLKAGDKNDSYRQVVNGSRTIWFTPTPNPQAPKGGTADDVDFFDNLCKAKGITPKNAAKQFQLAQEIINQQHGPRHIHCHPPL